MTNKKNEFGYVVENGEVRKLQHDDFIELNSAYIKTDAWFYPKNEDEDMKISRSHVEYFNMKILIDDIKSIEPVTKPLGHITTGGTVKRAAIIFDDFTPIKEDSGVCMHALVTLKKNVHYYGTGTTNKLYVLETADEVADKVSAGKGQGVTGKNIPEHQEMPLHKGKELDVLHDLAGRMERLEKAILESSAPRKRSTKNTLGPK